MALPTVTASHEYQEQRSAEGGSAIDPWSSEVGWAIAIFRRLQKIDALKILGSTAVASRVKSKRQMGTTISIKWYGMQKLNLFVSAANKCEPSSSTFEWRTKSSTTPRSATDSFQKQHTLHWRPFVEGQINLSATQIRMTSYKLCLFWRQWKTSKSV